MLVIKPKFLRTVGSHRASDWSFGLAVARTDIPEGTFGYVAPFWCDDCAGPCGEPEYRMTHRQTLEQPEEGVEICPHCGSEDCGENQQDHELKAIHRYSIHRNPSYRKTA